MSVKVTDNTRKINVDTERQASLFLRLFMDKAEEIADPITPKDTGRLRMDKIKQVLGLHGVMVWGKEYAAPQERGIVGKGYPVRHYTTAGTGAHYAFRAIQRAKAVDKQIMRKARLV